MRAPSAGTRDPHVLLLARLFREHPAWLAAARHLAEGASSDVSFSHLPGERWHLVRQRGQSLMRPGAARDPDFAFRFTPATIQRLAEVKGDIADVAVALFDLIAAKDEDAQVGFRIVAPFWRLVHRGYVRLLLAGGAKLLAYGTTRGVRTLADVERLVAQSRSS